MAQEGLFQLIGAGAAALLLALAPIAAEAAPKDRGPQWAALTADQQQTLAPLASEWNKLGLQHKKKWLGIAKRYPKMKPDEQARVQRRMQAWAKLTPKERQTARENYKKMEKLPPDKKQGLKQQWEEYNRLPEQERRKLGSTPRKPAAAARPPQSPVEPAPPPAAPLAPSEVRPNPVEPSPAERP